MDRTEHSLKAFIGLNRALDTLEKIVQQDVKNYGLNVTEFAVLELLYSKGPQPIQRIRDRVLIASSSISYVVTQLEEKGYLNRKKDEIDKRVFNASLTDKGQQLMECIFPQHAETIKTAFDILTDDELTTIQYAFKKISAQSTKI